MPIYTDTFPQRVTAVKTTTIFDLLAVLPDSIPWEMNVNIVGKIARFGRSVGNLTFTAEVDVEPSVEMRQHFSSLVNPLGIQATILKKWKSNEYKHVRLYNRGKLIVDRKTGEYTQVPTPSPSAPVLTADDVKAALPATVPWGFTINLTGGVHANGWSCNDLDFIIEADRSFCKDVKAFMEKAIGWKVDVGTAVMPEREPVYLCPVYKQGKLCQL